VKSQNVHILVLSVRLYCMMKADETTVPVQFTPSVESDNGLAANDVSDTGFSSSRCQLSFIKFIYHRKHPSSSKIIVCLKPINNNTGKKEN